MGLGDGGGGGGGTDSDAMLSMWGWWGEVSVTAGGLTGIASRSSASASSALEGVFFGATPPLPPVLPSFLFFLLASSLMNSSRSDTLKCPLLAMLGSGLGAPVLSASTCSAALLSK